MPTSRILRREVRAVGAVDRSPEARLVLARGAALDPGGLARGRDRVPTTDVVDRAEHATRDSVRDGWVAARSGTTVGRQHP